MHSTDAGDFHFILYIFHPEVEDIAVRCSKRLRFSDMIYEEKNIYDFYQKIRNL